jgi:hypothetical protein
MKFRLDIVLLSVLAGSCTLGTGSFAGKTCKSNVDCPDPYVCAQVRTEGRTCELVRGVDIFDPSGDMPVYYCNGPDGGGGVKAVLDKSCIANCHGTDMSAVGTPKTFRLDVWRTGTVMQGVADKVANINNRMQKGDMPPASFTGPRPTMEEVNLVLRWSNTGGLECGTSGGSDAGTMMSSDAGRADGGRADAGDGG